MLCILHFNILIFFSPWLGRDCPIGTSQFLEVAKGSASSRPLIAKLTNPEPYLHYLVLIPRKQHPSAVIIQATRELLQLRACWDDSS